MLQLFFDKFTSAMMWTLPIPRTSRLIPPIPQTIIDPGAIGVKSVMICNWSVKLSEAPESMNQSNGVLDLKVSEAANASLCSICSSVCPTDNRMKITDKNSVGSPNLYL